MDKRINVPNALAVLRLILAPIIVYFILNSMNYIALILFSLALFTDFIDGKIARKYNMITNVGKILDPISDKLLFGSVLIAILLRENYMAWVWFFGIAGILYIIGYFFFVKKQLDVANLGKLSVFMESLLLIVMIMGFVNIFVLILFVILLSIPVSNYLLRMIRK